MGRISLDMIVNLTIGFVLMGTLLPIGIGLLSAAGDVTVAINGTDTAVSALADANVLTMLVVIVPVVGVVALILVLIRAYQ